MFPCRPTSEEVTTALDRMMTAERIRPKHLIVDQRLDCKCSVRHFENVWCDAKNILPRFGMVGTHGSIFVVERFPLLRNGCRHFEAAEISGVRSPGALAKDRR